MSGVALILERVCRLLSRSRMIHAATMGVRKN